MKKISFILLIVFSLSFLVAESSKIAYVDVESVMMKSKDIQEINRQFSAEQAEWDTELRKMKQKLDDRKANFEKRSLILSEEAKKAEIQSIQSEEEDLMRKQQEYFGSNGLAFQRNEALMTPLIERINQIIEEIAIEENYDIVLNVSSGSVLYAKENLDISEIVIQRLDSDEEESSSEEK